MKTFFSNIEKSFALPLLIAIALGTGVILVLPPLFKKHDTRIIQHQNIYYNNHISFSDLDNDGHSEKINLATVNPDYSYVNFYNANSSLVNVWNLKGRINNSSLFTGDYNNDDKKEVYVLTMYSDSLFLNYYHYNKKSENPRQKRFITKIPKHYDKPDWDVSGPKMKDLNNDGYKDLVFSIFGEYSLQPRQVFVFDIKNNTFLRSRSCGTIIKDLKIVKSPQTNETYITGNTSVTNYLTDSIDVNYRDDKAWFIVYNQNLKPQFKPYSFAEQGTMVETQPLIHNDSILFLALVTNHFDNRKSRLLLVDKEGKTVAEKENNVSKYHGIFRTKNLADNQFYLMAGEDKVIKMNQEFKTLHTYKIPHLESSTFYSKDMDDEENQEIIQWIPSRKKAIIYKKGFSSQIEIILSELDSQKLDISIKKTPTDHQICFKDLNHYYLVSYYKRNIYPLNYIVYIAIFFVIFLLLYAIQKTIALRKLKTERTISQLKLTSIKNQIDPHFTLNALNAIGSSILNDYKEDAYDYLQRFSRLIRHSLTEADNITRSLDEEMNFIRDYLDVLQIRYVGKFDYQIELENNAELSQQVPKMLVQSFVENAINHGIKPKTGKGNLIIRISNTSKGVALLIQDDGIGRNISEKQQGTQNTRKGISNINEYITIFNKYNKNKISYRIIDLYDRRKPAGTKVIIYIPYDYEYRLH